MKRVLLIALCCCLLFCMFGCENSTSSYQEQTKVEYVQGIIEGPEEQEEEEKIPEIQYDPFAVGNVCRSTDWNIMLTNAYTSKRLESNESRTAWDANSGYAFLILEFDVTCLNSTKPTIDGEAITDLVANVNGNTYTSWEYQYINSEIWCYINNSYLDANLPLHIYVYAMIPETAINGNVSVTLNIAGQPKIISI